MNSELVKIWKETAVVLLRPNPGIFLEALRAGNTSVRKPVPIPRFEEDTYHKTNHPYLLNLLTRCFILCSIILYSITLMMQQFLYRKA
jgi:hypothetical protein